LGFAGACSVAALSDFFAARWLFGIVGLGFSVWHCGGGIRDSLKAAMFVIESARVLSYPFAN